MRDLTGLSRKPVQFRSRYRGDRHFLAPAGSEIEQGRARREPPAPDRGEETAPLERPDDAVRARRRDAFRLGDRRDIPLPSVARHRLKKVQRTFQGGDGRGSSSHRVRYALSTHMAASAFACYGWTVISKDGDRP